MRTERKSLRILWISLNFLVYLWFYMRCVTVGGAPMLASRAAHRNIQQMTLPFPKWSSLRQTHHHVRYSLEWQPMQVCRRVASPLAAATVTRETKRRERKTKKNSNPSCSVLHCWSTNEIHFNLLDGWARWMNATCHTHTNTNPFDEWGTDTIIKPDKFSSGTSSSKWHMRHTVAVATSIFGK